MCILLVLACKNCIDHSEPRKASKKKRIVWISDGFRREHPRAAVAVQGAPPEWVLIDRKQDFIESLKHWIENNNFRIELNKTNQFTECKIPIQSNMWKTTSLNNQCPPHFDEDRAVRFATVGERAVAFVTGHEQVSDPESWLLFGCRGRFSVSP